MCCHMKKLSSATESDSTEKYGIILNHSSKRFGTRANLKLTSFIFGRPYYRSSLWYSVSSVVCRLSSVMFCIVAKWCVLAKKCLKEWIGNQGQKVHFLGRRHISTSGFGSTATVTAVFGLFSTFKRQYLENGARYGQSYYRSLIGSHIWPFDWHQDWWPWMTLNCCKVEFSRNFAWFRVFGRLQQLNECR